MNDFSAQKSAEEEWRMDMLAEAAEINFQFSSFSAIATPQYGTPPEEI